jgi:hypothetical protein
MLLIDLIFPSEGELGAIFGQEAANHSKITVTMVI